MASDSLARDPAEFNRQKMMDRRRTVITKDDGMMGPANDTEGREQQINQRAEKPDGLASQPLYQSQQSPEERSGGQHAQNTHAPTSPGVPTPPNGAGQTNQAPNNNQPKPPPQRSALNRGFNNIRFGKEQKQAYTRIKQLREANKKLEKKLDPIQKQLRPLEALKLLEETKRTSLIVWCAVLCLAGSMLMITIFLFEIGLILFGIAGRILLLISRASLKIKKLKKQMEPLEKTRSQIRTKQDENEKKIKQEELQIQIIKNRSFLSTQRSRAKEQQPT